MSLSDHHVFHWFTTPKKLREIANEMEELWPKMLPGHDKTIYIFFGKTCELRILVDQDRISEPGEMGHPAPSELRIR